MPPTLIVIDLQNDFISASGALKEKHVHIDDIVHNLRTLCERFSGNVIFVRSEYLDRDFYEKNPPKREQGFMFRSFDNKTANEEGLYPTDTLDHLAGTHRGKKRICAPGTDGAGFPSSVLDLVSKFSSTTVTKHWYSAFLQTNLHDWLLEHESGDCPLYFAGVTANNCVLASLIDAFFLGYRVRVVRECVGATSDKLKEEALQKVQRYFGLVVSVNEVLEELNTGGGKLENRSEELGIMFRNTMAKGHFTGSTALFPLGESCFV